MENNYLEIPSKASIEAYVDTLEAYRNNEEYQYSATYISTKNTNVMEVLDARTRLGVIENKEAIDNLESRLEALENAINAPEYELVGRATMPSSAFHSCSGCVDSGNGFAVANSNNGLVYFDSNNNLHTIDGSEPDTVAEGFEFDSRTFRYSQVVFFNNKFFIYSRYSSILVETPDLKHFSLSNNCTGLPEGSTMNIGQYDYLFKNEDELLFLDSTKRIFSYIDNEWVYQGTQNIALDFSYLEAKDAFAKFNNKYYGVALRGECLYESTDKVNYTIAKDDQNANVVLDDHISSQNYIKWFSVMDNKLFIGSEDMVKFTEDGSHWQSVTMPFEIADLRNNYPKLIHMYYVRGKYYAMISMNTASDYIGIYKWTNLTSSPTCIYKPSEYNALKIDFSATFTKMDIANNNLYFTAPLDRSTSGNRKIFMIDTSNDSISICDNVTDTQYDVLGYTASSNGQTLCSHVLNLNGNIIFTTYNQTRGMIQQNVYKLKG